MTTRPLLNSRRAGRPSQAVSNSNATGNQVAVKGLAEQMFAASYPGPSMRTIQSRAASPVMVIQATAGMSTSAKP